MVTRVLNIEELGDVVILTLNRPDKRNALNRNIRNELNIALNTFENSKKVIIITGLGKAFCSGLDLKDNPDEVALEEFWSLIKRIQSERCIYIAAVNGIAIGGGLILANACDIVVGDQDSKYGMPNVDTNQYPILNNPLNKLKNGEKGQPWKDITGKLISGDQALDQEIINQISKPNEYLDDSKKIADSLCQFKKTELFNAKKSCMRNTGSENAKVEEMVLGNRKIRDIRRWLNF